MSLIFETYFEKNIRIVNILRMICLIFFIIVIVIISNTSLKNIWTLKEKRKKLIEELEKISFDTKKLDFLLYYDVRA